MLRDLFSLFPACAGVIPVFASKFLYFEAFPRMCGGDPAAQSWNQMLSGFSPHVRG